MAGPAIDEATKGMSQAALIRKRFFGHTAAMISLCVVGAIVLLVYTSMGIGPIPGWWQFDYSTPYPLADPEGKPTLRHPFGQDQVGRDNFAMTMRGAQQSIFVMVVLGAVACALGVVMGAIAGYFRGITDSILMRFAEAVMITPLIVIAAILGVIVSRSQFGKDNPVLLFCLFIGAVIWVSLARLVRAEFFSLREREFVDAARIAGAKDSRIIFKHVLPNAVGVIIVNTTLLMSEAILLESALSYLGFGVQPPDVSLGGLISANQSTFETRPWLFWWPGLFIVAICLSINFIGDGLRDAFDPRQKKFNPNKAVEAPHPELDELDEVAPVIRPRPAADLRDSQPNIVLPDSSSAASTTSKTHD